MTLLPGPTCSCIAAEEPTAMKRPSFTAKPSASEERASAVNTLPLDVAPGLIYVNIILGTYNMFGRVFGSRAIRRITMHRTKSLSTKSVTVGGIAASLLLRLQVSLSVQHRLGP
jgi:hypothetical protein